MANKKINKPSFRKQAPDIIDTAELKMKYFTDEEINKLLSVYQTQIDAGVQTIMVSHSSVNGVKMHENAKYLQYLKNEMGFKVNETILTISLSKILIDYFFNKNYLVFLRCSWWWFKN